MTKLEKRLESLGFNALADQNGWLPVKINHEAKSVRYDDMEDHSSLKICFSKFLLTITRIIWYDRDSNMMNVWEPRHDEEHISIRRIEHILQGTISPHTKT